MAGLFTGAVGLWGGFTGFLYGSTGLSTPPGLLADALFGANTTAGSLLGSEPSGMAINFLSSPPNMLVRSNNSLTTSYYSGVPFGGIYQTTGPVAFSRASLATVTDADGKIKWAPHNLLLASEQFDAANWTKGATTVSANIAATTAPNGTSTADKLAEDATTAAHRVQQGFNATIGATYTISIYAKAAERNWLQFLTNSFSGGNQAANFNLSNGTIGSGATGANLTKTITSVGSGWYLCTVTWTPDATGSNVYFYVMDSDAATGASYAGVAGNGVYLWGAHLYRSDLGGMVANTSAYPMYNPTTPKNLLGYTEDFSNAAWAAVANATVVTNSAIGPNGLQTADLVYPTTSGSNRQRYQTVAGQVSGTRYTVSVYAKAASMQWIAMISPNGANFGAYFDLINGVKGTEASGVTATITAVGDGWYRCSVSQVLSATTVYCGISFADANGGTTVTASGTSGVYVWGAQLSNSASLDPYVANNFAAPSAAAFNGPRLDYDPSTLAAKGLLVEEQRTNLVTFSSTFDNAAWTKSQSTVTASSGTAPDGTNNAYLMTSAGTFPALFLTSGLSSSGTVTFSYFVKDGTSGQSIIRVTGTNVGGAAQTEAVYRFTFSSATISYVQGGTGTTSVQAFGNGWYRISLTVSTTTFTNVAIYPRWSDATAATILIYGAQAEAGSFATSYIPTTSASVTRSADVAQVGTSAFPYSATEGTLVAAFDMIGGSAANANNQAIVALRETATSLIYLYNGSSVATAYCVVGGVDQAYLTKSATAANAVSKLAFAFKANDFAAAQDGGAVTTDTSGSLPNPTFMAIGNSGSPSAYVNGHIRQITYIPRRLSNAELQARTA